MSFFEDKEAEILGGAWNDGQFPIPTPQVHIIVSRDSQGLGIARCGLRQEHRSNGWSYLDTNNSYQQAKVATGEWPYCEGCFSSGDFV